MADNFYSSKDQDWNAFYRGIVPAKQTVGAFAAPKAQPGMMGRGGPGKTNNAAATAQIERSLASAPATRYAVDGQGQRVDPIGYAPPAPTNPAVAAAGDLANNVPLPRRRPADFPTSMDMAAVRAYDAQHGADPGMDGAMLGPKTMSPSIPAQLPPADGSSPLPVFRGDGAPGGTGTGLMTPVQQLLARYPGSRPSAAYDLANQRGAERALALKGTGPTPVQQLKQQTGMSGASAYDQANAAAEARARAAAVKPAYQSSGGGGDWFSSVTRA